MLFIGTESVSFTGTESVSFITIESVSFITVVSVLIVAIESVLLIGAVIGVFTIEVEQGWTIEGAKQSFTESNPRGELSTELDTRGDSKGGRDMEYTG